MKRDYVTNIRVNREDKEMVDKILQELGLNFSSIINLLMKQIILTKGVPFSIVIPQEESMLVEQKPVTNMNATEENSGEGTTENIPYEKKDLTEGDMMWAPSLEKEVTYLNESDVTEKMEVVEEQLFIEQSSDVKFEELIDGVSDLETNADKNDSKNLEEGSEMSTVIGNNKEDIYEDFLNAFQSMNIQE